MKSTEKNCKYQQAPALVAIAAMAYTWTVVRQIKALTDLCSEQRQELQRLTVVYQEKVLPALTDVNNLLSTFRAPK